MEPLDSTALNPVVTYKLTSKSRFHLIHFPTMSDFNNTLNTGNGRELERKDRATSDSDSGNVVDHYAPHGGSPFPAEGRRTSFEELDPDARYYTVTAEQPSTSTMKKPDLSKHVIHVEPLKRSEMQPSYAQDLGAGEVTHGFYGSMMHCLGSCVGFVGAVPCCPLPNPFRSVEQGSVGLVQRFGQFYKSVDPGLVQINVCTESLRIVDVKIQITPVGRQKVITRDNVDVEM